VHENEEQNSPVKKNQSTHTGTPKEGGGNLVEEVKKTGMA
jgi:hypothetical protein